MLTSIPASMMNHKIPLNGIPRFNMIGFDPKYVYRHQWRMGDALIWDNTGTAHRVLPFDMASGRRLHRVTLLGEEALREAA